MGNAWGVWVSRTPAASPLKRAEKTFELDVLTVRDESGRHEYVEQVRVTSPWFVTPQGIHVGSRLSAVRAAFPQAWLVPSEASPAVHQRIALYDDKRQGITFEFANGRRGVTASAPCRAILIHPKGRSVFDEYYSWYMEDEEGRWGNAL